MSSLPKVIFQRWGHSFEEDRGNIIVYRPADYNFPRARGRAGIEFLADGKFIDWTIGPADRRRGINGKWHLIGSGYVHISFEENKRPPRVIEILQCDTGILKIRQYQLQ